MYIFYVGINVMDYDGPINEHVYDRHARCADERGEGFNVLCYCNDKAEVWYNNNKTKARANSWGRAWRFYMPVTWLVSCQNCGLTSTPKKVQYRSLCDGWNLPTKKEYKKENGSMNGFYSHAVKNSKPVLCMSCWNKVRVLVKAKNEAYEIELLTKKLNKERLKCQKLQTQVN